MAELSDAKCEKVDAGSLSSHMDNFELLSQALFETQNLIKFRAIR